MQAPFISNSAHVLACLAEDPSARLRDVAVRVGITERAVQRISGQLEDGNVLTKVREGRRNHHRLTWTARCDTLWKRTEQLAACRKWSWIGSSTLPTMRYN
jgi:hypothetical protein